MHNEDLMQRALQEFKRMYYVPKTGVQCEMLDERHALCMIHAAGVLAGVMSEDGSWTISSHKSEDDARKYMKETISNKER